MTQSKQWLDTLDKASQFTPEALKFNRGIERESLRVEASGSLAKTPHPAALGSKLSHPSITTDFSEAQVELITPVSDSIDETLQTLTNTHRFVNANLGDEVLWAASMPCVLADDQDIPLADYGDSNVGRLKKTYRHGLGVRYGRSMQTICAVHYNFSFSDLFWQELANIEGETNDKDYRTKRYFDAMRNFRRFSWLAIYLTGASPAVCNSFVKGRDHELEPFDQGTMHKPYGTSLRNGNLGYQSDAQSEVINICYNNLDNYVGTLASAVCQPYPGYTALNSDVDGEHNQLNDSILQSEAEFYTTIRAKCVPPAGKNFLAALLEDGVEYIEVRLLDANPFEANGINAETIRFLDTLLLHCLLIDSPDHDHALCQSVKTNATEVVLQGRLTETQLNDQGEARSIKEWGSEILNALLPLTEYLDKGDSERLHKQSIEKQLARLEDPSQTLSGQVLATMKEEKIPFFRFAMNQSLAHKASLSTESLSDELQQHFVALSEASDKKQLEIDQAEQLPFKEYLADLQDQYTSLVNQLY